MSYWLLISMVLAVAVLALMAAVVLCVRENRRQKLKFKSLVDTVPCAISWISKDMEYLGVNQNLSNLIGLGEDDFLGKKIGFYGGDEEYLSFVESIFKTDSDEQSYEFQVQGESGNREFLSIAKKYANGTEAAIIGVDVTEIKEAQKLINEQSKALVATAKLSSLGEMAAAIGHEINNPLSVIISYAELMEELLTSDKTNEKTTDKNTDKLDKEQIIQYSKKINETALRIARIVKGLKTFAREGDKDPLERVPVSVLVDETLELCGQRLHTRGIKLTQNIDSSLNVECQKVQIQQVLLNLLNNAVDATEGLAERWLQIDAHQEEGQLVIAVTDSGSGIDSEICEKILQPFFTTKEPGKGTGLGLSISQGIIKDHQGEFFVDQNCANTRFVIRLPIRRKFVQAGIDSIAA